MPAEAPPAASASARPTSARDTSRGAYPITNEKNRACVIPPTVRPTATTANAGAAATSALLSAYPSSVVSSSGLRANREVATVSGTASVATITAYKLTKRPVTESETANVAPISGSSPTGSISVVTARNAPKRATAVPAGFRECPSPLARSAAQRHVIRIYSAAEYIQVGYYRRWHRIRGKPHRCAG